MKDLIYYMYINLIICVKFDKFNKFFCTKTVLKYLIRAININKLHNNFYQKKHKINRKSINNDFLYNILWLIC